MTCKDIQEELQAMLDVERALPPRLLFHLEQCSECNQFYLRQLAVIERLKKEAAGEDGIDGDAMAERVMAELEHEEARTSWASRLWPAAAAIGFIMVGLFFLANDRKGGRAEYDYVAGTVNQVQRVLTTSTDGAALDNCLQRTVAKPIRHEASLVMEESRGAVRFILGCFPVPRDEEPR